MRFGPSLRDRNVQLGLALLGARFEEVDDIVVQRESALVGWCGQVVLARLSFLQHLAPFTLRQESTRLGLLAFVLGHGDQHLIADSVSQQQGESLAPCSRVSSNVLHVQHNNPSK